MDKIIIKNNQLNKDVLESINNLIDLDINASAAYKLSKILKEIMDLYDCKMNMERKIVDKWCEKDENGNPVVVKDENGNVIDGAVKIRDMESFTKDMMDLMEVENVLQHEKIKFEELGLKTIKIKDIMKLDFIFY